MKCEICKKKIERTFLNKAVGTVVKDKNGKKHWICNDCQRGRTKEEILSML